MNRHIHYLKSYQLIKQLHIYAYLFEIYKSYQKHLENEAIITSLAAKEKEKSLKKPEPKPKTASRDFFDPLPFSLGANHLKSKTALRFFPLLHYNSRRGGRFLQNDPLGYRDSTNLYQGMNMNPYNYLDPMGELTLLIHGTYAKDTKWNQNTNSFAKNSGITDIWKIKTDGNKTLKESGIDKALSKHSNYLNSKAGYEAGIFRWSGENSVNERKKAGKDLANYINLIKEMYPGEPINIIAHSHGGNVVNEALRYTKNKIDKVVYLATPNQFRKVGEWSYGIGGASPHYSKTPTYYHPFRAAKVGSALNCYNDKDVVQTDLAGISSRNIVKVDRYILGGANVKNVKFNTNVGPLNAHSIMHGAEIARYIGLWINQGIIPVNGIKLIDDSPKGLSEE